MALLADPADATERPAWWRPPSPRCPNAGRSCSGTPSRGSPGRRRGPAPGLTPAAVAALAYRAREGLRQAYLQMHLSGAGRDECRPVAAKLGAYVRGGLAKRDAAAIAAHLDQCAECRWVFAELGDVNVALKGIVAPIVLGPAAVAYLASAAGKGSAGARIAGRLGWFRRAPKGQQATAAGVAAVAVAGRRGPGADRALRSRAGLAAPRPVSGGRRKPGPRLVDVPRSGPSAPGHPGSGVPRLRPRCRVLRPWCCGFRSRRRARSSAPAPGAAPSGSAPTQPASGPASTTSRPSWKSTRTTPRSPRRSWPRSARRPPMSCSRSEAASDRAAGPGPARLGAGVPRRVVQPGGRVRPGDGPGRAARLRAAGGRRRRRRGRTTGSPGCPRPSWSGVVCAWDRVEAHAAARKLAAIAELARRNPAPEDAEFTADQVANALGGVPGRAGEPDRHWPGTWTPTCPARRRRCATGP